MVLSVQFLPAWVVLNFLVPYPIQVHSIISQATCADCHMAAMNGRAGGHTFFAKGNFNGCVDCHPNLTSTTSDPAHWGDKRTEIQTLLNDLAAHLNVGWN